MMSYEKIALDTLREGEHGRVVNLDISGALRARLLDFGLISGTEISVLMSSFCKDPVAYYIRGAVIALRRCDAKNITVERPMYKSCTKING